MESRRTPSRFAVPCARDAPGRPRRPAIRAALRRAGVRSAPSASVRLEGRRPAGALGRFSRTTYGLGAGTTCSTATLLSGTIAGRTTKTAKARATPVAANANAADRVSRPAAATPLADRGRSTGAADSSRISKELLAAARRMVNVSVAQLRDHPPPVWCSGVHQPGGIQSVDAVLAVAPLRRRAVAHVGARGAARRMTQVFGRLGLQGSLKHLAGQLRQQRSGADQLLGLKAPDGFVHRASGSRPPGRSRISSAVETGSRRPLGAPLGLPAAHGDGWSSLGPPACLAKTLAPPGGSVLANQATSHVIDHHDHTHFIGHPPRIARSLEVPWQSHDGPTSRSAARTAASTSALQSGRPSTWSNDQTSAPPSPAPPRTCTPANGAAGCLNETHRWPSLGSARPRPYWSPSTAERSRGQTRWTPAESWSITSMRNRG